MRYDVLLVVLILGTQSCPALAQNLINRSCVVIGLNTGKIDQKCIVVLGTPPPEVHFNRAEPITKSGDGSFLRAIEFEIVSTYTVGTVAIGVKGKTVTKIDVNPLTQGTMAFNSRNDGDLHILRVERPFGRYALLVWTTDDIDPPYIEIAVNK